MIATAIAAALVLTPATGPTHDPVVDEWHTWTVTEVYTDTPRDADDVAWPQTYLGPGQLEAPCGWVQQDRYKGTRTDIDQILADGVLTYGEDFHVVVEWRFVFTGPCTTPTPTVTPTPEPTVTPEPTSTPEPSPTPPVTPEPTPTASVTPEPTPEPSQTPTPSVTVSPTPNATPSPEPEETEGVGPTPQYTEAATPGVKRLAETGGETPAWVVAGGVLALAAGAGLLRRRKGQTR